MMDFLNPDPKIKATVRKQLLSSVSGSGDVDKQNKTHLNSIINHNNRPEPAVHQTTLHHHHHHPQQQQQQQQQPQNDRYGTTNGSYREKEEQPLLEQQTTNNEQQSEENERLQWQPLAANEKSKGQPKFEAYMMTGEHILNISRIPQTTTIVPKQQKKVGVFFF